MERWYVNFKKAHIYRGVKRSRFDDKKRVYVVSYIYAEVSHKII